MHIKMNSERLGSPDGHTVARYCADCIYEVPHGMGTMFIRNEWASEVQGEVVPPSPVSGTADLVANAAAQFNRIFRPQPTRGSAPTNPQTLHAKGNEL